MKDLKAAGIPIKHLQRYLHAHRCKYCEANLGRASYYCTSAKQPGGDELLLSTIVDPLSPHMRITQTLANEHQVTSAPPEGTANCSPAGTDLRIDWADACSLGRNGERYFLLVVDKDTE